MAGRPSSRRSGLPSPPRGKTAVAGAPSLRKHLGMEKLPYQRPEIVQLGSVAESTLANIPSGTYDNSPFTPDFIPNHDAS